MALPALLFDIRIDIRSSISGGCDDDLRLCDYSKEAICEQAIQGSFFPPTAVSVRVRDISRSDFWHWNGCCPGQQKSATDDKFAAEAASGGMAEVKLGELAQQKATSDKIKDFGQKMVTDHSKAGDELKQVAQQQGFNLSEELSKQDQATYDRLSKLGGKQFDEAYARAMLTDHQKDVAAFEKEASSGKNEALKDFALRTLPTLKEHLKMAHDIARSSTTASI
jgi:putative membrane protein